MPLARDHTGWRQRHKGCTRATADSAYRLIFETDGQRVTEYRAGLLPAVEWVEGCS